MPDHTLIKERIEYIFQDHKDFFDQIAKDTTLDAYMNAFIALNEQKHDLNHYHKCFDSLKKACLKAIDVVQKRDAESLPATASNQFRNTAETMEYLSSMFGTGKNRDTFKNWVEGAGFDRTKNLFSKEEVQKLVTHVKDNFNNKGRKRKLK
jgi:hypothetical protein